MSNKQTEKASMELARIYQPARCTMQSGLAKTISWILEYQPNGTRYREPLMGWIGTRFTKKQVLLKFKSREEAVAYAERQGIPYVIAAPHKPALKPKSYSANFAATKISA